MVVRTVSEVVFACHSSACRPPTSGGTGGSSPSGGSKLVGAPLRAFRQSAANQVGLTKGGPPKLAGGEAIHHLVGVEKRNIYVERGGNTHRIVAIHSKGDGGKQVSFRNVKNNNGTFTNMKADEKWEVWEQ